VGAAATEKAEQVARTLFDAALARGISPDVASSRGRQRLGNEVHISNFSCDAGGAPVRMSHVTSAAARRSTPAVLVLLLGLLGSVLQAAGGPPAQAADSCTLSTTPGYTVRVCLEQPTGLSPLQGNVPVAARIDFPAASVAPPAVVKVSFWLDEDYLLTDQSPGPDGTYGFTWRTARAPRSIGTLVVKARLADGALPEHRLPVSIADAGTAAPNQAQFQVRHGSAPAPDQRFRMVAIGDAVNGTPEEHLLADRIATWSPNLLSYLGDVYEGGSPYEFDNWYGDPAGLGRFRDITNPTVGNHEYVTPGAAGYFDFWDNIPHYYSYDVAGWHVVTLDSSLEYNQLAPGTAQYDWLAADLAANRARCTIVTTHHPRFAPSPGAERSGLAAVWSLLAARRVTLALAGHIHHYERWKPLDGRGTPDPRGVTQLIAGAGGHQLTPPEQGDPRIAATSAGVSGALVLDLGATDVSFNYLTTDGVLRDSGTIPCKSTGDPLPPTAPTGLRVTPVSASRAHLGWVASTDTYGVVAGYTVRRNGAVVARLGGGETSYLATGLSGSTRYSWTVQALDDSHNESGLSAAVVRRTPPAVPSRVSSRTLLHGLHRGKEVSAGYRSAKFGGWLDLDRDGCQTPAALLISTAVRAPRLTGTCGLVGGRWRSAYDGVTTADRTSVAVEHLVPLAEAWQSGARRWSSATRQRFTNDLAYGPTLDIATRRVLAARGSAEPRGWLPPRPAARCTYVARWVAVKWRWRLSVDPAEARFLGRRLKACGWPRVERPARAAGTAQPG
jgi:hypothetical protein